MSNFNLPFSDGFMDASGLSDDEQQYFEDDEYKFVVDDLNDDEQQYFEDVNIDSNPTNAFTGNNTGSNDFSAYEFDDDANNIASKLFIDEICNNDTKNMNKNLGGNHSTEPKKYPPSFKGQTTNNGFSCPLQRQKRKRNSPDLNPNAQRFQKNYYKLITKGKHKVVRKELIVRYHRMVYNLNIGVRPLLRDPTRIVNVYFNTYADQESLILSALNQLILQGAIDYEIDYGFLASQKK